MHVVVEATADGRPDTSLAEGLPGLLCGVAADQVALGWTHAAIGSYLTLAGAHEEGRALLVQALGHFRQAGDLRGQAFAHLWASLACAWTGNWGEAITQGEQALALYRQAGDRRGQGHALASLGECHARQGNYDLARGYAQQVLQAAPTTDDPMTLAFAWDALGFVHSALGEPRQAMSCYQQALAFARERQNSLARKMLVIMLAEFGDACRAAGDLPAAADAWQQALQLLHDLRLPDSLGIRARLEQSGLPSPPG